MDEEEYASDTSDDDYVPSDAEAVSEEEESGDEEQRPVTLDESGQPVGKKRQRKTPKNKKETRKRQGGIRLESDDPAAEGEAEQGPDEYNKELAAAVETEKTQLKEVDEKKKADSLWADFMKDVGGPKPKPAAAPAASGLGALAKPISKTPSESQGSSPKLVSSSSSSTSTETKKPEKVTITQEFDFAGEVVKITKEVDVNSKEAKAEMKKTQVTEVKPQAGPSIPGLKRPGGGGLGNVLGKINKKQKISTLDKSKLDWNSFKQQEGIADELSIHNRGKDGYIERMAFLERTDVRQFELERDVRLSNSKR